MEPCRLDAYRPAALARHLIGEDLPYQRQECRRIVLGTFYEVFLPASIAQGTKDHFLKVCVDLVLHPLGTTGAAFLSLLKTPRHLRHRREGLGFLDHELPVLCVGFAEDFDYQDVAGVNPAVGFVSRRVAEADVAFCGNAVLAQRDLYEGAQGLPVESLPDGIDRQLNDGGEPIERLAL